LTVGDAKNIYPVASDTLPQIALHPAHLGLLAKKSPAPHR
jgi:hypothetical protein